MTAPKKPTTLDKKVHAAVRAVILEELGYGPAKLRTFLKDAVRGVVEDRFHEHLRTWRSELYAEMDRLKTEAREEVLEVRNDRDESIAALKNYTEAAVDKAVRTQVTSDALRARITETVKGVVNTQLALDTLAEEVRKELQALATEQIRAFVQANFTVAPKPSRKLLPRI